LAGHEVFVFNRDVKPGGLGEYCIYPVKTTMKSGLRKQLSRVLSLPNLHYFGNVKIGSAYDVTPDDQPVMNVSGTTLQDRAESF
jgi:ferredoxin--NADP+ reductase